MTSRQSLRCFHRLRQTVENHMLFIRQITHLSLSRLMQMLDIGYS